MTKKGEHYRDSLRLAKILSSEARNRIAEGQFARALDSLGKRGINPESEAMLRQALERGEYSKEEASLVRKYLAGEDVVLDSSYQDLGDSYIDDGLPMGDDPYQGW